MNGHQGIVKWGYLQAMRFTRWHYEDGTITATVDEADSFRLEQEPLCVEVPVGEARWRWPVLAVSQFGSTVAITVGPQLDR